MSVLRDPIRRRWLGWGALALIFLLVNLHRLSTAVLADRLTVDFAVSASQLGAVHAAFFIVYAVIQIPAGVIADRYGPRYVGAAGAIVLSLGAVGFAASTGFLDAFAARLVIGLGSGVIFIAILRYCANWFRVDEFATLTGLTGGIAGLGAILATTPLAVTVGAVGWRPTVVGLAFVGLATAGAVLVLVRRSPVRAGLDPIERVPSQPTNTFSDARGHVSALLADRTQWLLSTMTFMALGTILTIIGLWGVPYLVVVYDLGVTAASTYTLLGSLGILVGAPLVGWISDRTGRRLLPMVVGFGVMFVAIATIPVLGRPPLWVVAAAYFVIGFAVGFVMLGLTIIKERYPAGASGVATATVNGAGFFGATAFPYVMGLVLDRYRTGDVVGGTVVYTEVGYRLAFAIVTIAVAIAFLSCTWLYLQDRAAR